MEDPEAGRVDITTAEEALGINDENREFYRMAAALRLLLDRNGVTDSEVQAAYEHDLVKQLREVVGALDGMVRGGLDANDD